MTKGKKPNIIKQHDKRSGHTYFYESISYWDPEKKQSRAKRTMIGKLDPNTGEMVPTDGRMKKKKKRKNRCRHSAKFAVFSMAQPMF